ncbi:hypothetical protein E5N72_00195 [Pseudoalteromonas sp. MEBiC 03607]|uniref:hypothetical protein n=1 Tax=Pseudoalteromonas sp. MEBiC 03607 TaxID=2563601 RepID=UPI001093C338|nr:hypothetical protein [Pseudoalteromonas sp. MEBiC 03607]TGV18581.1 hypothetical protein E5N72_00195 [Pseudoalteromonas sp. MEBiC 03607]
MPRIVMTDKNIQVMVRIINEWNHKLSMKALCENITKQLGLDKQISKKTLLENEDVSNAYYARKEWLRNNKYTTPKSNDLNLQNAFDEIDKLRAELESTKAKNKALIEQFVRWQYNLYMMSINMDQLNWELPQNVAMDKIMEVLKDAPLPPNVDAYKLNEPMPQITRADDNKLKRI